MKPEDQQPGTPRRKFSLLFYNPVTYAGVVLALLIFTIECFLFGFDFFSGHTHIYLGILTYCIFPVFLIIGLLLIPAGALWKRRRVLKGKEEEIPRRFTFDIANEKHRNALLVFIVGTMTLIIMTAVGSYKAFHYTESVHFCGIMCHSVMEPQYTAYLNSSHARVKCVECHIGEGAEWYVRSKFSGVRQIFATIGNTYERPIPTPVHNLRPAKETCEQCHWPGKFYSSVEMKKTYHAAGEYDADEWNLHMLVHVGSDQQENEGIHAHMYTDHEVYYVADDERRQEISWVKSVDKEGREMVYTTEDSPYKDALPPTEKIRKMDCMDCHNRPSHHFDAPYELVNAAMTRGKVSDELPEIKSKAMALLSGDYATQEAAAAAIRGSLEEHYREVFGGEYQRYARKVAESADAIVEMYKENFFPKMKARWDAYPDNIGHLISPGCFRCHDDGHKSPGGKLISKDCNSCHTIISQGPPGAEEKNVDGLPFVHPFEDDGLWQEMICSDCHTGN